MEDLLRCIFTLDPDTRMTPADALRHPFLAIDAGAEDGHLCSQTPPTSTPTPTHHAPADKATVAAALASARRDAHVARQGGRPGGVC